MSRNGFRGSHLPPSRRVEALEVVRSSGGSSRTGLNGGRSKGGRTNDSVLADYLSAFGPQELNLVVVNRDGRSGTNTVLADLLDLLDYVTLRTSHGREPSTFNKELLPGLFMSPTSVQEAIGEWGIQSAVDLLQEGLPTLGPRPLTPPEDEDSSSPMMWLVSAGDPALGEQLYGSVDGIYRPHRHLWSHARDDSDVLRWALVYQLSDHDIDLVFPNLREQSGYDMYLQRSDRYAQNLNQQTGLRS